MTTPQPPSQFDATLTSRYECKYLLSENTARGVRRYLSAHAKLDPFSARSEHGRYRVMSLYLDSPSLRLYWDTAQGVRNRFKLRLRYYAEYGNGPVFLEVKKRSDVIVRKSRELVTRKDANDFLRDGRCKVTGEHGRDATEFFDRCRAAGARPALRLRYWREAWESRSIDPVRITFDTGVEHSLISDAGLEETRACWDRTPIAAPVILELKFTDLRPLWVDQMLRRFQLDKVSVAKYAESIDHVRRIGRQPELQTRMRLNYWQDRRAVDQAKGSSRDE